jgi:2-polyprenyl-6-hydroxyphenyl methylase/3-demethylubiquinone-9 3-methyltransferase
LYTKDGNRDFISEMAPPYIKEGMRVYDVGGGKQPFINLPMKKKLKLFVTGLDISQHELESAPTGTYDEIICADISTVSGYEDGDLVICQAVLEHVRDTESAIRSISSLLKPGGIALIFVPSRNAVFARLNLFLPQKLKEAILYYVYPSTRHAQGFPSYYWKCTPKDILELAKENGLTETEARYYYTSSYFNFLLPLHVIWRGWVVIFRIFHGRQAAETFSLALRKDGR